MNNRIAQIGRMNIWTTADPASQAALQANKPLFDPPISVIGPRPTQSPLVFSFAHSGRQYPPEFLSQTRLTLRDLRRSEDAYVDQLFPDEALKDACFIKALFPRTWVDANRHPQAFDPEMFVDSVPVNAHQSSLQVRAGFGVIPKLAAQGYPIYSHRLTFKQAGLRLKQTHIPYHQELKWRLMLAKQCFGFAILVDCHSMPSEARSESASGLAQIVLGDRHGRSCNSSLRDCLSNAISKQGFTINYNQPFAGGYSVQRYGKPDAGIHAIQIEVSRSLYMNEETLEKNDNFKDISYRLTEVMRALQTFALSFDSQN